MNISMLVTLSAVVSRGSFTAAADVIGCSPSAVSLQVRQMEAYFGRPLFERSTRRVTPTDFALEVVGAVGDVPDRLQALRLRPVYSVQGRIRVGVITSMQSDVLPQAIRLLGRIHPALEVVVPPINDTEELVANLKASHLELALVVRPEAGGSRRLRWRDLYRQPYVLLAPSGATEKTARQLLRAHPWISYDSGIAGGRAAARIVRSMMPGAKHQMELRSTDAIVAMVAEGLGVAVVPEPRAQLLRAYPVREIPVGGPAAYRRLSLVWKAVDDDSRNVRSVIEALVAVMAARQRRVPALASSTIPR